MNTSKLTKIELFTSTILGACAGGFIGAIMLLCRVFTDPITVIFCALSGAKVSLTVANFTRELIRRNEEARSADLKRKEEDERSHYIAAKLLAAVDVSSNVLAYIEPTLEKWIDEHRQSDGSICRGGEVIELWSCTFGSPVAEVNAQITRNRCARWLGVFDGMQLVAILAD